VKLLALDSAGSSSSVVVWRDGALLGRASERGGHHGEQLLALVEQCLQTAGLALTELDAIACGRGPGAFTGVRLAVSVAQGLAFAAGRPVLAVSNLEAAAEGALRQFAAPARLLVCHDARMHEVYWAAYERGATGLALLGVESVAAPAAVGLPDRWTGTGPVWGVGTGFGAYPGALAALSARLERCIALEADAEDIARVAARLGLQRAVDPELAAPLYLRDDVAAPPPHAGPGAT
jgi:tRNA threonylcarbamoyladenosine biosynthesis protein TsaB